MRFSSQRQFEEYRAGQQCARFVHKVKELARCVERRIRRWRKILLRQPLAKTAEEHYSINVLCCEKAKRVHLECASHPLISVVVPVYKVDTRWLTRCIESISDQYYEKWELILVDDGSCSDNITSLLNFQDSQDARIRSITLTENVGIAEATNVGIRNACGDFVAFLDHDDEFTPDALTWIVWAHNKHPQAAWFYSDEDKISPEGKYRTPHFKPDFSPEFLLSTMFTCHLSVYATEALRQVGGLRSGFDGSQDHDLALRLSEIISRTNIVHIPRILYHWREIHGSTARAPDAKPDAYLAGRRAVTEALARRGVLAKVLSEKVSYYPCLYSIEMKPTHFPSVTIFVPTRNSVELVKKCAASIRACTRYPNYKIVVIDNQSNCPRLQNYLEQESTKGDLTVHSYDKPFNHSDMHNDAIIAHKSEFIVFLNNDIEITSDRWLEQLVATTELDPKIAGVGALLAYPKGRVQHGGIIMGINGIAGHAHRNIPVWDPGYFGRLHCLQEFSGVTAALSLIRRSAFLEVGGFRSDRYPTSFNDVDLWLRLRQAGYRCIYNPLVQAIHYESKTRGRDPGEKTYEMRLHEDWRQELFSDPFYNPNLAIDNEQFYGYQSFPPEILLNSSMKSSQNNPIVGLRVACFHPCLLKK